MPSHESHNTNHWVIRGGGNAPWSVGNKPILLRFRDQGIYSACWRRLLHVGKVEHLEQFKRFALCYLCRAVSLVDPDGGCGERFLSEVSRATRARSQCRRRSIVRTTSINSESRHELSVHNNVGIPAWIAREQMSCCCYFKLLLHLNVKVSSPSDRRGEVSVV
jgi:hypothetical protein